MHQRTAAEAEPSTHGLAFGRPKRADRSHSSRRTTSFTRRLTKPPTSGAFDKVDETAVRVRFALHRLPDLTDRSILVLRFFVGLSLEDISEQLLLPLETVRERYHVGLTFMERELGGFL